VEAGKTIMSVAFITMGKFAPVGDGIIVAGGGGAPQMKQEEVKPRIHVKTVSYKKKGQDDDPIIIVKEVS
jgi:hypothetical protein